MVFADVLVENYKHDIVKDAYIFLARHEQDNKKRSKIDGEKIALCFDDRTSTYRGEVPAAGVYSAEVSADGYETDRRDIRVGLPGPQEWFVLGRKGMPFYFQGEGKVPFDTDLAENLLGVAFDLDAPEDAIPKLERELEKLGMKSEKVPEAFAHLPFRIFRFYPDTEEHRRSEILKLVLSNEAVEYAGPLVQLDPRNIKLLTNDFIAKFRPEFTPRDVAVIARKHGMLVIQRFLYIANAYLLRSMELPGLKALKAANDLARSGTTLYVGPDFVLPMIDAAVTPADVEFANQWHLSPAPADANMQIPEAWQFLRDETTPAGVSPDDPGDITFGSENVVIAIFDSGVQSSGGVSVHPDFNGQVTGGADKVYRFYDFRTLTENNNSIPLNNPHGINVAGVAAALAAKSDGSDNDGVVGVGANCRIIAGIRPVFTPISLTTNAWSWLAGIPTGNATLDATLPNPGADIINNSFIYNTTDSAVADTFTTLAAMGRKGRGTIIVFAAGNANVSLAGDNYAATHPQAIAVAASTRNDGGKLATSNFGADIDVCAPGEAIHTSTGTTTPGYGAFADTSAAAPIVSGIVGLMLSINPRLNWQEVRDILRDTADKIADVNGTYDSTGHSSSFGFGRVNALNAVTEAKARLSAGTDIVIRDNLTDLGPVPSGTPFWNSPDIWVRRANDPIPPLTGPGALLYDAAGPHENPERGHDNYVFLRVKNVGTEPVPANEVQVRALICHWPGFEFNYPDDWVPSFCPTAPETITEVGTYLIGGVLLGGLAPGDVEIVKLTWPEACVPPAQALFGGMTVNWHPCMLVEISPQDGPFPTGTVISVRDNNNLAQKNITIIG